MTDFPSICRILGRLYSDYKDELAFREFIEKYDLGLPLANLINEELCEANPDGVKYVLEAWQEFLLMLSLEDEGFEDLDQALEATNGS